jgi:hypothetical protein
MSDSNLITYRIEDDGANEEDNGKHFKGSPPRAKMEKEKYDKWSAEYAYRGSRVVNNNGFAPVAFVKIFSNER